MNRKERRKKGTIFKCLTSRSSTGALIGDTVN